MQQWIYYGVHHDPHYRAFVPGMLRLHEHEITDDLVAHCVPPIGVAPYEVRITLLPDLNATAYAWRENWKTHVSPDPVFSLFVTSDNFETPAAALVAAARAFPEVWSRYQKLTIGETCTYAPKSSEASVSSTSETEPPSKPGKASAKLSA